ncbi:hypothetical protein Hanom_Chr15g01403921 [Helianthus anomalus]
MYICQLGCCWPVEFFNLDTTHTSIHVKNINANPHILKVESPEQNRTRPFLPVNVTNWLAPGGL